MSLFGLIYYYASPPRESNAIHPSNYERDTKSVAEKGKKVKRNGNFPVNRIPKAHQTNTNPARQEIMDLRVVVS